MSTIKHNVMANYGAAFWTALMSLAFVPLYIKFMGIESYGLVGVYVSLLSIFGLLDLGLRTTLNREIARMGGLDGSHQEVRDLVRTLESVYWVVAAAILLGTWLLSGYIAHHWVKADKLSADAVQRAVVLMGIVIAIRWPAALYAGGLLGLQRQVALNCITCASATVQGLGAVLILWQVSGTIHAFLGWQALVGLLETSLTGYVLWSGLPPSTKRAAFRRGLLLQVWRFSAGMFGITILAMMLTQTDKIILSRLLRLDMFGYYMLAWTVAAALLRAVGPIQQAVFPRFSELVVQDAHEELRILYHRACQLVAAVLVPAAVVLVFFSHDVLTLWTGDPLTAANTAPILALLAVGTALNGLMYVPYSTQLAYGWTSLAMQANLVATVVLVPAIIWAARVFGPEGAAAVWIILNSGYILIVMRFMHRRILTGELRTWYCTDIMPPVVAALAVVIPCWWWAPQDVSRLWGIIFIGVVSVLSLAASSMAAPAVRESVMSLILRREWIPARGLARLNSDVETGKTVSAIAPER